jgi:hypothetical protein
MFLNDACDSRFDARHRSERPIPSGAIRERTVWILSVTWLGTGTLILAPLGKTFALTLGLVGCIVLYDVVHKKTAWSPVVMAACRFLLYLVAASTAIHGITSDVLWNAAALTAYVIGLSFIARRESTRDAINHWALLFLLAPVPVAIGLNGIGSDWNVPVLLALFAAWLGWCLRPLFAKKPRAIGRTVSGLLAGIVLVDFLALQGASGAFALVFPLLFAGALLLQRFIPAT